MTNDIHCAVNSSNAWHAAGARDAARCYIYVSDVGLSVYVGHTDVLCKNG